jgi:molybdopterin-containing oxidoreductase family membrane subunit
MRTGAKTAVAVGLLGILVGSYGMFERLAYGLNPVAFGSYVPWGLWVSFYLFFLGLSAGAFLITTLTYVFGMKRLEALAPISAFTVLVCLLCEGLFILLDLGTVSRSFYQFFLSPSFTSLLTWMLVLFSAMGAIYALKTYLLVRGGARRLVTLLSWISMPVGLLFYGTNGAFFAILANRPLWNSSLTPLLFIVAALLSGGALITFLSYTFLKNESSKACIGSTACLDLGHVIKYLLILFLALEVMQFSVGYVSAKPNLVAVLNYILAGPSWWVFWVVHLFIGSLVPLAVLFLSGGDSKKVAQAALLIVVTFVAVRYDFVVPEFSVYPLDGLESAFVHPRLSTAYSPNLNEWLVSVWIISLGLLAFTLGVSRIPVLTEANGGKDHE